jgi:hypothetical protein
MKAPAMPIQIRIPPMKVSSIADSNGIPPMALLSKISNFDVTLIHRVSKNQLLLGCGINDILK